MRRMKWQSLRVLAAVFLFSAGFLWLTVRPGNAQEGEDQSRNLLVISSSDASSAPTIVLRAYGMDSQGIPLNLTPESITILHGGQQVSDVESVGDYKAGTFTIFLVDTPPGVSNQLPAIQQAIEQFASPPEMEEQVDYVAVYQVGESEAIQLLAPTNFYNGIRNFFAVPLELQAGPTALVDSLGKLLDEVESLKPKDDLATFIVVMTDGTDVVSTKYEPDELGKRAAEHGVPIHTIWLENENLQSFSHEAGQNFLAKLAADSRGVAAWLTQVEQVQSIWDQIGAFRNHRVFQYRPAQLVGGTFEVVVSLLEDPEVQATTIVTISTAAPTVTIDLPVESRQLTLENLDEPVDLSLATTVAWLDGVERKLTSAQLLVNGVPIQEIDVSDINRFQAQISNFTYGANTIQVAVEDEQGLKATSPEIILTVSEGETQVPEEIEGDGLPISQFAGVILGCFLVAILLLALILVITSIRKRRKTGRQKPERPLPDFKPVGTAARPPAASASPSEPAYDGTISPSYLEIFESVTRMPPSINLYAVEHRIGRNPNQADIAFENDITVSRLHASIILEGSDYRIYDEGSTSGTWVNGQLIPEYGIQLIDGDEIQLGEVRMRYRRL